VSGFLASTGLVVALVVLALSALAGAQEKQATDLSFKHWLTGSLD
jgi:hypothetical protein